MSKTKDAQPKAPALAPAAPIPARAPRRPKTWPEPLTDEASLARARAFLAAACPVFQKMVEIAGPAQIRKREGGLPGLARIVIDQQVSTAAARSIAARLEAAFPGLEAEPLAQADEAALTACGLSRPKAKTLAALARAARDGELDFAALESLPAAQARERLCALHGIGPWSADIYLSFCLGAPDAFPAGDLALQEAARLAFGLKARPDAARLERLSARWRPARAAAALQLWAFYHVAKAREGIG